MENSLLTAELTDSCWSGVLLPTCPASSKIGCESDGDLLEGTVASDPDVQRGLLVAESVDSSLNGNCWGSTTPDLASLVALSRWIGGIVSRRETVTAGRGCPRDVLPTSPRPYHGGVL